MSTREAVWRNARGPQRLLYAVALLFIVSAVIHAGVYALTGGAWEGAVTWRKPIEFSLSFAIATATFGWILGLLPARRIQDRTFAIVYSVSSVGEVGLIIMQRWRGTASHFNFATAFDTAVFSTMGVLILLISFMVLWLAVRSFGQIAGDRATVWAVRLGLLFFVAGLGVGFLLLGEGSGQASVGSATSPVTVGANGMLTFPHALALHALQVLLVLTWLAGRFGAPVGRRVMLVLSASVGYFGLVAIELAQALGGSGPLELAPVAALALTVALLSIGVPFVLAILRSDVRRV